MAKTDPKVMAYVEKALAKDPDMSGSDLYDGAKKVSAAVGRMSRRQFHARYPLQIKRRSQGGGARKVRRAKAPGRRKGPGRPPATRRRAQRAAPQVGNGTRDAIRGTLLSFAVRLASAEGGDVVQVMTEVDGYVDQIIGHMS